jgi:RNA polymerase sigma-70 factor (ECF subfamily)
MRERRIFSGLVSLAELETLPDQRGGALAVEQRVHLNRLLQLIQRLKPLDRQVIISWLEGLDADAIGEITGLSSGNVAVRVNRVKNILARRFAQRGNHAE